ncbi:MAG: N-acetyltransferase family protein [Actinomycetota bacterium]
MDLHDFPDGYTQRPAIDVDLEWVIGLMDDADRSLGLDPDPIREYLTWIWHVPSTDLERDTRLVTQGSQCAGYAQGTWSSEEGGPLDALVRVHPDHLGRGIGSWALAWVESLATQHGSEGVRAKTADRNAEGRALLTSRGHVRVRTSFTMGRDLVADEDAGVAPPGVTIRAFETGRDEHALHQLYEATFADHWGFRPIPYPTFAAGMYGAEDWDPSLAHVAEIDGQLIGHVVALSFAGEANIESVGVLPPWRGRGIAKALLRRAFAELAKRGHHEVRLGVDAQNPTGAVALYESVGMTRYRSYDIFDLSTPEADRTSAPPGAL